MKRSIRVFAVLMLVAVLVATFVACSNNSIVGKWEDEGAPGFIYEFKPDGTLVGTYKDRTEETRYKVEGDKLIIYDYDETEPFAAISIDGDTLTMYQFDGDGVKVFKRV